MKELNKNKNKNSVMKKIKNIDLCTVWSPVTDHYVNKVKKISVNSKCHDCFYVADKGIISSND